MSSNPSKSQIIYIEDSEGSYFPLSYLAQVAKCTLRNLFYMRDAGEIPYTPYRHATANFHHRLYTLPMIEAFVFAWRRYRGKLITRREFLAEMNENWPKN